MYYIANVFSRAGPCAPLTDSSSLLIVVLILPPSTPPALALIALRSFDFPPTTPISKTRPGASAGPRPSTWAHTEVVWRSRYVCGVHKPSRERKFGPVPLTESINAHVRGLRPSVSSTTATRDIPRAQTRHRRLSGKRGTPNAHCGRSLRPRDARMPISSPSRVPRTNRAPPWRPTSALGCSDRCLLEGSAGACGKS